MAKRPKSSKEKIFVAIKKSPDPISQTGIQVKLNLSQATLLRYLPSLLATGCIEEMPTYYADMLAMSSGPEGLGPKHTRKVKFYRTVENHSCTFCEVF